MNLLLPASLQIGVVVLTLRRTEPLEQGQEQLFALLRVVEGADGGLLERHHRAIGIIAPGLQPVVFRKHNRALGGAFVLEQTDPGAGGDLLEGALPLRGLRIGVAGIHVPEQRRRESACGHAFHDRIQIFQGGEALGGPHVQGLGAQHGIEQRGRHMGLGGHGIAAEHHGLAARGLEIM